METEIEFNNIQVLIYENKDKQNQDERLLYIGDIYKFNLQLQQFAAVLKQTFSFSKIEFKYHSVATDDYLALLSIFTSNLFAIDIHKFKQKQEYTFRGEQVSIRLFKLHESLGFFEMLLKSKVQLYEDVPETP